MSLFYSVGKLLRRHRAAAEENLSLCEDCTAAKRSFAANETSMERRKGDSIDLQDSRYDRYGRNEKIGNEMRY